MRCQTNTLLKSEGKRSEFFDHCSTLKIANVLLFQLRHFFSALIKYYVSVAGVSCNQCDEIQSLEDSYTAQIVALVQVIRRFKLNLELICTSVLLLRWPNTVLARAFADAN